MNSKKLFLIAGLALLTTILLTIAAFRLAEPKLERESVKKASFNAPSSLPKVAKEEAEEKTKEEVFLSEKGEQLIHHKLVKPISRKFGMPINLNQFSRCPSGVQFYQVAGPSEENPYFILQLYNSHGCMPVDLCELKVSANEEEVEVWNEKTEKYITTKEFIAQLSKEDLELKMEIEEEQSISTSPEKTL